MIALARIWAGYAYADAQNSALPSISTGMQFWARRVDELYLVLFMSLCLNITEIATTPHKTFSILASGTNSVKNKHSLVVPNKRPFCRHHYVKSSYVSQPDNRSKLSHFPCSGPNTVVFWNCVSSGKHMSGETSQISGVCHRKLFLFFKLHFILASNFIDWSSKQSQE